MSINDPRILFDNLILVPFLRGEEIMSGIRRIKLHPKDSEFLWAYPGCSRKQMRVVTTGEILEWCEKHEVTPEFQFCDA